MAVLDIPPSDYTPHIYFEDATDTLWIKGESYPENAWSFYAPLFEWVRGLIAEDRSIKVCFLLDYLNTSSTKMFLDLLKLLEEYQANGKAVSVVWYYQAGIEVMKEAGEDLFEGLSLNTQVLEHT